MGWDAYALSSIDRINSGQPHLDVADLAVFQEAEARLVEKTGKSNLLGEGMLGGSFLLHLKYALPISYLEPNEEGLVVWEVDTVRQANFLARWDYAFDSRFAAFNGDKLDHPWLTYEQWETRFFLGTCSQHGFAILFTF